MIMTGDTILIGNWIEVTTRNATIVIGDREGVHGRSIAGETTMIIMTRTTEHGGVAWIATVLHPQALRLVLLLHLHILLVRLQMDRERLLRPPYLPPPPPPPDKALSTSHPPISIPLPRKPAAPMDVHSPTPMPLPPAKGSAVNRDQERAEVSDVRKREPVRRSRKEEYEAYGRTFEGCGMQSDYDVTTKLGEGTFG